MKRIVLLAAAAAAVAVSGCSSAAAPGSAAMAPAVTTQPVSSNLRVCQHYRTQRAWVKNLAMPTEEDAYRFETWTALDQEDATPGTPLARDLRAMVTAQRHSKADYGASGLVKADCEALGVQFQP